MDGVKNIVVDISMTSCDQNTALNFELILLPLFLLLHVASVAVLLRTFIIIKVVLHLFVTLVVFTLRLFVNFNFIFLLFFIRDVKAFKHDSF